MVEKIWPVPEERPKPRTLAFWRMKKLIPFVKVRGRIYFELADVESWASKRMVKCRK